MKWLKQQDLDSGISFMTTIFWIQFLMPVEWELVMKIHFSQGRGSLLILHTGCSPCVIRLEEDNQVAM